MAYRAHDANAKMAFDDGSEVIASSQFRRTSIALAASLLSAYGGRFGVVHIEFRDGPCSRTAHLFTPDQYQTETEFSRLFTAIAAALDAGCEVRVTGPDGVPHKMASVESWGEPVQADDNAADDPAAAGNMSQAASSERPLVDHATGVRPSF